jgi:hypothetical protein
LPGLGYYRFHDIPTTWYKAVITCTGENGHLLILNSHKEFIELKKIWDASGVKGEYLHIGINDFDKETEFVTVFGKNSSCINLIHSRLQLIYTYNKKKQYQHLSREKDR